ncbi:MAG: TetR/AcrR family transcriptional regulator [Cyanobacteria bacterium J06581_3]
MVRNSTLETKEQILEVAECAIAQNGYAGTTLRNIVGQANVNLAAVHYHFGSKEELLTAVLARISEQIVAGQLAALDELLTDSDDAPSIEAILRAYLGPPFTCAMKNCQAHPMRAQFIGRCRTEPDPVRSIADRQFRPSTQRFLDVLQRALPQQTRSQLTWKLDLVVSSLVRVLGEAGKPGALLTAYSSESVDLALMKLVGFLKVGLESN